MKFLRSLIGDDADLYAPFYDPTTVQRPERNLFVAPAPTGPRPNAAQLHREWLAKNPRKTALQ